jgi:uncharacterized protein (TIGR02266 family)
MSEREPAEVDPAERRREQREPITLVVDYEGIDDLLSDYTDNLSTGGTFVHTQRTFEVGTQINLILSFPGLIRPIALAGTVRWTRSDDAEPGVGIEFADYDESVRTKLNAIIEAIALRGPGYVSRLIRVLVVEDNPHVARLIRDGLDGGAAKMGANISFDFKICGNGHDALELLESERFDALIIDIYLPILDGPTVIERVRAADRTRSLPVIAVSAGGPSAREAAMRAGANFFLDKPMRLRQVIESMKKLLGLEEQQAI